MVGNVLMKGSQSGRTSGSMALEPADELSFQSIFHGVSNGKQKNQMSDIDPLLMQLMALFASNPAPAFQGNPLSDSLTTKGGGIPDQQSLMDVLSHMSDEQKGKLAALLKEFAAKASSMTVESAEGLHSLLTRLGVSPQQGEGKIRDFLMFLRSQLEQRDHTNAGLPQDASHPLLHKGAEGLPMESIPRGTGLQKNGWSPLTYQGIANGIPMVSMEGQNPSQNTLFQRIAGGLNKEYTGAVTVEQQAPLAERLPGNSSLTRYTQVSPGILPMELWPFQAGSGKGVAPGIQSTYQVDTSKFQTDFPGILMKQAEWIRNGGQNTFKVTLIPEGMGQIQVQLESNAQSQITLILAADSPHAKQLLDTNLSILRLQLEQQGLQVNDVKVVPSSYLQLGTDGGMFQQRGQRDHWEGSPGRERRRSGTENAAYEEFDSLNIQSVSPLGTKVGIDTIA